MPLISHSLGSDLGSASYSLCDLGQVTYPPCSVISIVKEGQWSYSVVLLTIKLIYTKD